MNRRELLALYVVALVAAALIGTHGIAYWDAGDYVRLALDGQPSGLLLGRPFFLFVSRPIAALAPSHAEAVLRWFWTMFSATAAPLLGVLAMRLGLSRNAALAAAFALACSPSFAHTAHQVLTDAPALALAIGALAVAAKGEALPAGVLLGLAIATRETAAVHAIAVVLLLRRRAVVGLLACAVVTGVLVVAAHHGLPPSLRAWGSAMHKSSTDHPLGLRDVALSLGWVLAAGPVPVLVALGQKWKRDRVALVAWPSAFATALLLFYPDGSFSPRYMLATAPLAFFLIAAPTLAAHPRRTALALALPLFAMPFATARTRAIAARGEDAAARFADPPRGALLVPGHYCPHVRLALRHRDDVSYLCPGWDWPEDVARTLDEARCHNHIVVIDVRDDAWVGAREDAPRVAVQRYAHEQSPPIATLPPLRCPD